MRLRGLLARLRWIHLAPVLAFVALSAWAFASPIGAAPDDDYHLTSTWCAVGGSAQCEAGSKQGTREVSAPLVEVACYALRAEKSAGCQSDVLDEWNHDTVETSRGNFFGEYPPIYYAVMHVFAGSDLQVSAVLMRLFNAALFVALGTVLAVLLPLWRRPTLLWGWLVTFVPLGMFIIPSNNPSGWAVTGVGTAFLALLGSFETSGRRRGGLVALTLLAVLMAAGARGDAAVYVAGAMLAAVIVAGPWRGVPWRSSWRWAWLPTLAILIAAVFFLMSGQVGVAGNGFAAGGASVGPDPDSPKGLALVAYNLLMLPLLWTGVWGTSALGWNDTGLPEIVSAAATAAFIVLGFIGIGKLDRRKAIAAAGVLLVLVVIPIWVLSRGGNVVGENLQPRYILPLIVLFAFVLLSTTAGTRIELTRAQMTVVFVALALANLVALQVNIRRYVTGVDEQGFNLDAGAEWWWTGFPVGPMATWMIGALAYAGLLALLWPQLRRRVDTQAVTV
jgi:hypothetical protein